MLGAFIYQALRGDPTNMLGRGLIIGGLASFFYTFMDSLFVDAWIITYLKSEDIDIFKTPVSVVLIWTNFITVMIYLYQRLRSVFGRFYVPSLLTGVSAFLSGVILNYLGYHARLWIWNIGVPPLLSVGPVPLFVPTSFFLTFSLSPYIVGMQKGSMEVRRDNFLSRFSRSSANPISGGIRCTVLLSATLYLLFRLFSKLSLYM